MDDTDWVWTGKTRLRHRGFWFFKHKIHELELSRLLNGTTHYRWERT